MGKVVEQARLLRTYGLAVWRHWKALTTLGAIAALEWARAKWWPTLLVPVWVRLAAWVAAVLPAQYLAWRDAWEARGTVERPSVPKGIELVYQEPESPDGTAAIVSLRAMLRADRDLRGRAIEIHCNNPVILKLMIVYWHYGKDGTEGYTIFERVMEPLGLQSFCLTFGAHDRILERQKNKPLQWVGLKISTTAKTLGIVRVDERKPQNRRGLGWWRLTHWR